jgi:putative oxidoreductase
MQRLFSTFPNSWPGCGLLFLRLAAALPLILGPTPQLGAASNSQQFALRVVAQGVGGLLVIGLWTPLSAALQLIAESWSTISAGILDQSHIASAVIGLSLTMLGPGAWSVDARLFGRRRIDINSD